MPTGGKATVEITPLIEDGNNYYDRDEIMYADYKDKAVVQYALTPSGDAAHWYIAAFKSSISGSTTICFLPKCCKPQVTRTSRKSACSRHGEQKSPSLP